MISQAASFLAGVVAVLLCPQQLPAGTTPLLAAIAVAALCRRAWQPATFLGTGALLAHLAVGQHFAGLQQTEQRLLAEVQILGIPRLTAAGLLFDAELNFPRQPSRVAQRGRVTWRDPGNAIPRAGDRWHLALRLQAPRARSNPDAVDLERNSLRDHIQVVGRVLDSPLNRRLAASPAALDAVRQRIADRIMASVPDPASAALLAALAVGATGDVSRESWRVFNATGITHLVAISGLHVTLFAMLAMAGARRLWIPLARLGLQVRRDPFAALAGMLLATGYALLAGFSVPTQRTLLMLGVWLLWRCTGRSASGTGAVTVAAILVLLWDPFSVLAAGFWLSFVAVCAIIWIAGGRPLQPGKLRAALLVQFAVTMALLPVTFAIFGSLSLAGLLVNIVAIPLFSLLLVPAVLGATAALLCLPAAAGGALATLLLGIAGKVAMYLLPALSAVANLDFALWWVSPPAVWYALALPAVALALLPWASTLRLSAALCLLPLSGVRDPLAPGALQLTVFDVGQATAVLVGTRNHSLLYGTGDSYGSRGGPMEQIILPHLRARRIRRLDALLLDRVDRDTAEGLLAIDAQRSPAMRPMAARAAGRDLPPQLASCEAGQGWIWDGVRFEVLYPSSESGPPLPATSCVLRISGAGGSLLLTGNADAAVEQQLLARGLGHSDVLLVPRHGSAQASTQAFLQAVAPRYALASLGAGSLNTDSLEVVKARYAAVGAGWYDTASNGALQMRLQAGSPAGVTGQRTRGLGVWRRTAADPLR